MAAIRAGIVANLAPLTDPGVTVGDSTIPVQVLLYQLDDVSPPSIVVEALDEIDYTVSFGSPGRSGDLRIIVQAVTGTVLDAGAQIVLDTMLLGDTAVKKLIESDPTLGGSVEDSYVSHCTGHKLFPLPGKKVLGAEWTVLATVTD